MEKNKKTNNQNNSGKDPRRHFSKSNIANQIMHLLDLHPGRAYTIKQVQRHLFANNKRDKNDVKSTLFSLVDQGKIDQYRKHFQSKTASAKVTGRVDHVNPSLAYIVTDEESEDIIVRTPDLNGAIDGDTVKLNLFPSRRGGSSRKAGEVIEILERKHNQIVGNLELSENYGFVVPNNRKIYDDIFIPGNGLNGAKEDDLVVVEVLKWPQKESKNPEGKIIKILGKVGENDAEMHAIMLEFGLPYEFPNEVMRVAESIPESIPEKEIKKRKDFRKTTTFTIDPEDAKDFDDALSLRELPNGNYEIGIHIADVTYYLKEGSILDKEAYKRATSVYLVDRTVPMLPEKLSNNLCSLRPNEDRLAFAAVFEIDKNAKIHNQWFGRTIIHSDHRFAYEDAQELIENGGNKKYAREINTLNNIAGKLRELRFKNGSIAFESTEIKFKLDEKGKPIGLEPKIRKDAHKMIEEFMLLANKKVAEYIFNLKGGKGQYSFVYRTHDYPDREKLMNFASFAKNFGHNINIEDKSLSKSINSLSERIEGKPEQNILQSLAIRAMAKAIYTTSPNGHFGLAFQHYTHFTSPIRRYPDVMVHRLLQSYLDNENSKARNELEKKCQHSSEMEKLAADAERASVKYKQIEWMQEMTDREFEGIVSGMNDYGIYVELIETKCEGMIRMRDIEGDFYELEAEKFRVVGQRTGRVIKFGDKLNVIVKSTDINRRTMDLLIADNGN